MLRKHLIWYNPIYICIYIYYATEELTFISTESRHFLMCLTVSCWLICMVISSIYIYMRVFVYRMHFYWNTAKIDYEHRIITKWASGATVWVELYMNDLPPCALVDKQNTEALINCSKASEIASSEIFTDTYRHLSIQYTAQTQTLCLILFLICVDRCPVISTMRQ